MKASQLGPTEKTAILLLALGEEIAAEVMRSLESSEVKRIGAALSQLGRVPQETIDIVLGEFLEILQSDQTKYPEGSFEFTKNVLNKAFKGNSQGVTLIDELSKANVRMSSLDGADADSIYRIIAREHPQTIALVLAHAGREKAGAIVRRMSEPLRTEVIQRISRLDQVSPEVIRDIDDLIRVELERMGTARKPIGGADKAAAIINQLNPEGRQDILDRLAESHPDLESEIRSHLFTFEDLIQLNDYGMRELHRHVGQDEWLLALRGAPQEVLDLVLRNLSSRAAENLKDDMEAGGPKPLKDVQAAQKQIVEKALQLAESGKIILGNDTDLVV